MPGSTREEVGTIAEDWTRECHDPRGDATPVAREINLVAGNRVIGTFLAHDHASWVCPERGGSDTLFDPAPFLEQAVDELPLVPLTAESKAFSDLLVPTVVQRVAVGQSSKRRSRPESHANGCWIQVLEV